MNLGTFNELYQANHKRLLCSVLAMTRNQERAEDITATTFAAAWSHRHGFRGESSFSTWVYTIARNEVRSGLRRERHIQLQSIDEPGFEELRDPKCLLAGLERQGVCERMRQIIHAVPVFYRRVLIDHFLRGDSIKKIARRRRIPTGTVLSRLSRGRELLREAIGVVDD